MLREFHSRMTAQIFAYGGTVDKYIGDGIFAVFGVPTASADDAASALVCAEMMLDTLERWNDERERSGEARARIGIGLNYGPAVLGDIGSDAQHVVHGDWRYGQHGVSIADADPRSRDTFGDRRPAC